MRKLGSSEIRLSLIDVYQLRKIPIRRYFEQIDLYFYVQYPKSKQSFTIFKSRKNRPFKILRILEIGLFRFRLNISKAKKESWFRESNWLAAKISGWEMYHLPKKVSLRNAITQNPITKRMSPEEFTHSTKGWLQPRWKCHWASSRGEKMHHFSDSQIGSSVFSLPIFLRSVVMRTFVMPNGGFCGSALSCCKES